MIERGLYAYWQAGKGRADYNRSMETGNLHTGVVGSSLRNLLYARCVAIIGHALVMFYLLSRGEGEAPGSGFIAGLGLLTMFTVLSFLRLGISWPVRQSECALQLLADVAGLTLLLYFSGGAHNPMVVYYLVIIGFGVAILPRLYCRALAITCVACGAGLVFYHLPLPAFTPAEGSGAVPVAWLALLLGAGGLGGFAADMAAAVRKFLREQGVFSGDLQEGGQIPVLSSLAAGAAAELDAPLATMSAALEEMQDLAGDDRYGEDYLLLAEQLDRCRGVMDKLSLTARLTETGERRWLELAGFVEATVNQWLRGRPEVTADISVSGKGASPRLEADYALSQAFEHLLNNAADAHLNDIHVDVDWNDRRCSITVDDQGPGFPEDMLGISNKPVVRSGRSRMGIGLVICRATVASHQGYVELRNRKGGGASVIVHLPRRDA